MFSSWALQCTTASPWTSDSHPASTRSCWLLPLCHVILMPLLAWRPSPWTTCSKSCLYVHKLWQPVLVFWSAQTESPSAKMCHVFSLVKGKLTQNWNDHSSYSGICSNVQFCLQNLQVWKPQFMLVYCCKLCAIRVWFTRLLMCCFQLLNVLLVLLFAKKPPKISQLNGGQFPPLAISAPSHDSY